MADEEKKEESTESTDAAEKQEDTAAEEKAEEKQADTAEEKTEEKQEEASADADDAGEEVEIPEKFKGLIEQIEQMSVLDLNELVETLEKRFGVSAAAVAAAPAGGEAAGGGEEQTEFTVSLTAAGDQKIQVIKAVKEVLGLGLKEAKDMVEGAPVDLKAGVAKEEAEEMKSKIEEAGGSVELK